MIDECECGHQRSSHTGGLYECRWCKCKKFRYPEIPDIFDELDEDTEPVADTISGGA